MVKKFLTILLFLIILSYTSTTSAANYNFGNTTLKNGSRGEAVKELQRFLNANLNLGLKIDGNLGSKTITVIKKWQKDNGLVPDGLIGAKTKLMMNSMVNSIHNSPSTSPSASTVLPENTNKQNGDPVITNSSKPYSCNNISTTPNTEGDDVTSQKIINGRKYCIHAISKNTSESTDITYTYTTANGNGTKIATFDINYHNCGLDGGPTNPAFIKCKSDQATFIKDNDFETFIDITITHS